MPQQCKEETNDVAPPITADWGDKIIQYSSETADKVKIKMMVMQGNL